MAKSDVEGVDCSRVKVAAVAVGPSVAAAAGGAVGATAAG